MRWSRHLVIFVALLVNLWLGGQLVEELAGRQLRVLFEVLLILGYLWLVVGIGRLLRDRRDEPPPPG